MGKKLIPLVFAAFVLAGAWSSCKKHITDPPDDTTHKCDTCADTTHHPCDTCNVNKDSAAHAFTWKEFTIPSETNLTGVWVFAPNDITIIANSIWHFDGTNFTVVPSFDHTHNDVTLNGAMSGYSIFAFSKTDFWLVHGSDVLHTKDGQYFDDYRPGAVNACWGSAPNDVFIVGNGGHIAHYDGTSFTQMISNTTKDIGQIWGTSDNNIWASGWNPNTGVSVLLHYDGVSWIEQNLSNLGDIGVGRNALIAVWNCDSMNHHITVTSGSFIYRTTRTYRLDSARVWVN